MLARIFAVVLFCAGLFCLAQAQVLQTGAGKGAPGGGGGAYVGPGDVVSGAIAWWGLRAYSNAYAAGLNKIANICNPTPTCVDVNSTASGNLNLAASGLGCNNSTVICNVAKFYDQSGGGNCGGPAPCDTSPGTKPNLVINCIGSLPCIDDLGNATMSSPALVSSYTIPYTISTVAERTISTGQASITEGPGAPGVIALFGNGANVVSMYAGNLQPTAAAADSIVHTLQFVFNNTTSSIFVDATPNSPLNLGISTSLAGILDFPGSSGGGLTGKTFEAGWWPIGFNGTQSTNMHNNQCTYWGTTC